MEQHIIYALVGNFLSGYYPMWWKFEDAPESELAPIPAFALFQYLNKKFNLPVNARSKFG